MEKQKYKAGSGLWNLRQRLGIEIKQVARLMGHKSPDSVERYEKGRVPSVKNCIKLMLIYNSSFLEMFPDLYEKCRDEVSDNIRKGSALIPYKTRMNVREHVQYCSYEKALTWKPFTSYDRDFIKSHVTKIANELSDIPLN